MRLMTVRRGEFEARDKQVWTVTQARGWGLELILAGGGAAVASAAYDWTEPGQGVIRKSRRTH